MHFMLIAVAVVALMTPAAAQTWTAQPADPALTRSIVRDIEQSRPYDTRHMRPVRPSTEDRAREARRGQRPTITPTNQAPTRAQTW